MTRSLRGHRVSRALSNSCSLPGFKNVRKEEYLEDIAIVGLKEMYHGNQHEHSAQLKWMLTKWGVMMASRRVSMKVALRSITHCVSVLNNRLT